MTLFRRLAYATLTLAFAQIVFGAIVRITGSGMGCGDHWPTCAGQWFPPHDRIDLIIEITHRYIAAALTLAILGLLLTTVVKRREPGVAGAGGVMRPAILAAGLVVTAAVFGAVTVKMGLNPYVIVTHLSIAMALLAVLVVMAVRAGGFGGGSAKMLAVGNTAISTSPKTYRAARGGVVLAFLTIVLGALTANVAGANSSCQGFPTCRVVLVHGVPLAIQITHRVLAFLLLFHTFGMAMAARKRVGPSALIRAAWIVFGTVLLQIFVAAMLVELHLPPVWRSIHQATGTLVWLAIFTFAILARYATQGGAALRSSST